MQDLERNKRTIRSLYENVLSEHRLELADALFAPELSTASEFRAAIAALLAAFPDIRYTVHDLVAESDHVAVRWRWTGTFEAPFRSFAPTGTQLSDSGIAIFTMVGGRIARVELQTDRLGFLQQLGLVPAVAALRTSAAPAAPQ